MPPSRGPVDVRIQRNALDHDRPKRTLDARARGFACGLGAYLIWGLIPIYFKALQHVPALEILAHRVVWSVVFLAAVVSWQRRWPEVAAALAPRSLPPYLATTVLISANWLMFLWSVNSGRLLDASLGYFINPLVNVVLGFLLLRERLSRLQLAAIALLTVGVLVMVVRLGFFPWISLALATTFGLYGLLRKTARIDAVVGLFVETALLSPIALAFLLVIASRGAGSFGASPGTTALLASSGVVTAVPLILFALGVRSLRLSTMGLLQYVSPTGQFFLAVALYREPFTATHAVAFACIWSSLAIYSFEALRGRISESSLPLD